VPGGGVMSCLHTSISSTPRSSMSRTNLANWVWFPVRQKSITKLVNNPKCPNTKRKLISQRELFLSLVRCTAWASTNNWKYTSVRKAVLVTADHGALTAIVQAATRWVRHVGALRPPTARSVCVTWHLSQSYRRRNHLERNKFFQRGHLAAGSTCVRINNSDGCWC
jgi:hypothetical protein